MFVRVLQELEQLARMSFARGNVFGKADSLSTRVDSMRESSPSLTPYPLLGKDLNIDRQARAGSVVKDKTSWDECKGWASTHQKKSTALICRSVPSAIVKM
jgi:hypothetical protein